MRRLIPIWGAFVMVLLFAATAGAQTGRVSGQVLDENGKPWAGVTVTLKNDQGGAVITLKTETDGKFSQVGMKIGTYTVTFVNDATKLNYSEKHDVTTGTETVITFDLKDVLAKQGVNPDQQKQQADAANKFKNMQTHFNAGKAAMDDSDALRKQLTGSPADQRAAIQEKLKADNETAVTELQEAEEGVQPKDVANHAVVLATLGVAFDHANRYDDAATAYQKAIDLQPAAPYYRNMATAIANAAVSQPDAAVTQKKLADAGAACDKAAVLEPTATATCWKNIGVVLSNKNHLTEAVEPLQKATKADPKDAQALFLLGGALTSQISTKQVGDKLTYTIPPGTLEAYQASIDADPNGPYAGQAKAALDGLTAISGGTQTKVNEKKAPAPKKK